MATEAPEVAATGDAAGGTPEDPGFDSAKRGNAGGMTITEAPETVDGSVDGGASDTDEGASEPHDPPAGDVTDEVGDTVPASPGDGGAAAGAGTGDPAGDVAADADGSAPADTVGDDAVVAEDDSAEPVDSADQVTVQSPADPAAAGTWDGFAAARDGTSADGAGFPDGAAPADGAVPANGVASDGAAFVDGVAPDGVARDGVASLDGAHGVASLDGAARHADATVQAATHTDGVDPAYALDAGHAADPHPGADPADGDSPDAAYLVAETGPEEQLLDPPGSLAAVVAEHLAGPPPDGQLPDSRTDAAQAVLDVLRASGWSDTAETAELKAEVERLRELLDMVVRDHRVRVATAANGQNEQAHWLVPLLRAAHGVSFGTLGAKVHLRTAVQDVPSEVLSSAGLRIDDAGPAPDDHPEPEYR